MVDISLHSLANKNQQKYKSKFLVFLLLLQLHQIFVTVSKIY